MFNQRLFTIVPNLFSTFSTGLSNVNKPFPFRKKWNKMLAFSINGHFKFMEIALGSKEEIREYEVETLLKYLHTL